jgi:hypothetical protein
MFYRWLFPLLWLAFVLVWIAMARGGKAVAERESERVPALIPFAL